ncbi:hypothetical protein GXW82_16840 [Streptacidiphilus sp. 4-A2]|nr:hypothetical protein [Streptacidiphilus sp. 4-A2]
MDTILLTMDAVLGVLGSALSLSAEVIRARGRGQQRRPDSARRQLPTQDGAQPRGAAGQG